VQCLTFPPKFAAWEDVSPQAAEKCSEFEANTNNMEKFIKVRDVESKILHTVQTNFAKTR